VEKIMSIKQIATACSGICEYCDETVIVSDVVTDSRKAVEGAVFIALRGENFDGHDFVGETLEKGAVACIVDKRYENVNGYSVIVVEDTLKALGAVAAYYRSRFSIPSVGITGSVGKTSTKDMVSCVLSKKYEVLKTEGNFNNEIGLPLTAFRLSNATDIAVFEMGMSNFGEISRLTRIAQPDTAIITNIGMSHIEHLGSQDNILKAKLEIIEGMSGDEGTLIVNGDDPFLQSVVGTLPFETLTYGIENEKCDIVATDLKKTSEGTTFSVKIEGEIREVTVNTPGLHHVYNALAAMLAGVKYNMPLQSVIDGVADFVPQGMRQNIIKLENSVIIKDCYNASPTSMKSGIEVLCTVQPADKVLSHRRVAVLADMLELGEFSEKSHLDVGAMVAANNVDCLVTVGNYAKYIAQGALENGFSKSALYVFSDNDEAKSQIMRILQPNDIVLFKGSRGMRLEQIADFVIENEHI